MKQLREIVEKPPLDETLRANRRAIIGSVVGGVAAGVVGLAPVGVGVGFAVGSSLDRKAFKKAIGAGKYKNSEEAKANAPIDSKLFGKVADWDKSHRIPGTGPSIKNMFSTKKATPTQYRTLNRTGETIKTEKD